MMPGPLDGLDAVFSTRYAEARSKFLDAARAAGLEARSIPHPRRGPEGEALALDIVRDGPPEAAAVLLVSSACHGVEGHCGSGLQVAMLRDRPWREAAQARGVAVVHLHALNPWGYAWSRRTTHENVDLNRNFVDFDAPLPANPDYDEIADLLVPLRWPPTPEQADAYAALPERLGPARLQRAITRGQHDHPGGLFHGGRGPTWSHLALRQALREEAGRCARLAWIDIHTGLGPCGVGERIWAGPDDPAAIARARRWWGDGLTSIYDGSSTSASLTGMMWSAVAQECPRAEYTGLALEFGTVPLPQVVEALRFDQCLENQGPAADPAQRDAARRGMRSAFLIDTPAWRAAVIGQGFQAARQALQGLALLPAGPAT